MAFADWTFSGWHGWVFGWKLHLACTVAGVWIPLAARLTPANVHDGRVAPLLIEELPEEARNTVSRALLPGPSKEEWRRALVTKRRGRLTLAIDGKTVLQDVAVPGLDRAGRVALRHDGRAVEFANVYLKQF